MNIFGSQDETSIVLFLNKLIKKVVKVVQFSVTVSMEMKIWKNR
jgi:hypothetical protein